MMKCDQCGQQIPAAEAMQADGQTLCEDCYIDRAAKPKACDPWAVYSARNLPADNGAALTESQTAIVDYLGKNGPATPAALGQALDMSRDDLEREMAVLRHMEKVRAQMRKGEKVICLW